VQNLVDKDRRSVRPPRRCRRQRRHRRQARPSD
jgi:hypothetical protein